MLDVIEDMLVLTQVDDPDSIKAIELNNHLKTKQQEPEGTNYSSLLESLNSDYIQLNALKATLKDMPEINAARILYFKEEIELGNYQVNSKEIAMNLINVEMV